MKNFYYLLAIVLMISVIMPHSSFAKKTMEARGFEIEVYENELWEIPVELTEIKTYTDIDIIKVEWSTALEVNNMGFEIERSTESDENFTKIGFVQGGGNSNVARTYTFDDENVIPDIVYYYRLKQVDLDGTFEYSKIVSDKINPTTKKDLVIFPNPAFTNLMINFNTTNTGREQYRILNLESKTLFSGIMEVNDGRAEIDVSYLPKGMYFIEVLQRDNAEVIKFIVEK